MKPTSARKSAPSHDGHVRRGVVRKALRFVGEHPTATTATALAAGVGAYALVRRTRTSAGSAHSAGERAASRRDRAGHPTHRARRGSSRRARTTND